MARGAVANSGCSGIGDEVVSVGHRVAPRRRWPAADARGADGGGQWREVMEIPRAPDRSGAAQWSHGESGQWRGAMEP
jgi:hypothetical protein